MYTFAQHRLTTAVALLLVATAMSVAAILYVIRAKPEIITIESGGYNIAPPVGEATRRADLIVIATPSEKLPTVWNRPSGVAPDDLTAEQIIQSGLTVMTPYKLEIDQVLKGDAPRSGEIALLRPGGQIGDVQFVQDEDFLGLEIGRQALLWIRDCGQARQDQFDISGAQYRIIKRYLIDADGSFADDRLERGEVLRIVETERNLEPQSETPC